MTTSSELNRFGDIATSLVALAVAMLVAPTVGADDRPDPATRDAGPEWTDTERARALSQLADRALQDAVDRPELSVDFAVFQDHPLDDAEPLPVDGEHGASATDHDGDGKVDDGDLARAAQNPIADLISLPFQNNTNLDVGELNYTQNVLNIQPVIPFHLNEDWNLITRTIIPVIYQPAFFSGDDHDFGLGDIQFTAFFSPTKTFDGWTIGGGPVFRTPTATDDRLGARKWSVGPSAVVLRIEGPWVIGSLFQNVWSVAGTGDGNVNEFLWQPFINYNIPDGKGWYLTTGPIITANWEADSGEQWTIPLGGGAGRVFRIGDQPVNVQMQTFYQIEKPDSLGDWSIRFQFQFLFPQ